MARRQPAEESLLFDLPLDRSPGEPEPEPAEEGEAEPLEQGSLPLTADGADAAERVFPDSHVEEPAPGEEAAADGAGGPADAGARAVAGLADLGVCAAVMVILLVALLAQGLTPGPADWPAGLVFLLTFSFLYLVLPLAFWGRSPGMTLAGLKATGRDGRPMTFRQAVLRWLGALLTVALAGLPLLLALGGRSLSDLMSGTLTRRSGRAG